MKVLGIETSCDETAAAVVEDGHRLLSSVVASSMDLHVPFGGVVPEIAARSHIELIVPVILQALKESKTTWNDIDAIAVTYGAGLGGSLLVGVMTARTLAIIYDKPLYSINHVEAHIYANFLTDLGPGFSSSETKPKPKLSQHHPTQQKHISKLPPNMVAGASKRTPNDVSQYTMPSKQPDFPMLAIIVSGGHSQLALFESHFKYRLLGQTHDDAIGEAFDKVAKMLGLPYPGGPSISKAAKQGDPNSLKLPKAKMNKYDFSFSGLKTAVLRLAQSEIGETHTFPSMDLSQRLSVVQKANIAASFQRTAVETIVDKVLLAIDEYRPASVVIAGGVAANQELRHQLTATLPLPIEFPDLKLCTDNGAMIATLGCFKKLYNQPVADPYRLNIAPSLSM